MTRVCPVRTDTTREYKCFIGKNIKNLNPGRPSRHSLGRNGCGGCRSDFRFWILGIFDRAWEWCQYHNIEATILRTAPGRLVASYRVKLTITRRGQVARRQSVLRDQQPDHLGCPRCRKLPVRCEVQVMNWDVIGMAFNPKIFLALF